MLPHPRQVGEPQIDHLDLLVLDRLQEIFGCRTIRNHGFTPVIERGALKIVLPFGRCLAGLGQILVHVPPSAPPSDRPRSGMAALAFRHALSRASRRLQLWCGPRMSFKASSICRQVLASSTSPFASRSMAFWAASAMARATCASSN